MACRLVPSFLEVSNLNKNSRHFTVSALFQNGNHGNENPLNRTQGFGSITAFGRYVFNKVNNKMNLERVNEKRFILVAII